MIWFDIFRLQSPQLAEHSCSARMNWDLNKVIIISGASAREARQQSTIGKKNW